MLPHDVIREAAKLIRAGGLSKEANARDALGTPVALFGNTRSGAEVDVSRAAVNPSAISFSIYGALAAAIRVNPTSSTPVWVVTAQEAERTLEGKLAPGGTNDFHPVIALSNHEATTAEDACAFLERCALLLEPKVPA